MAYKDSLELEASQIMDKARRVVTIWSPWWWKFISRITWEYDTSYSRITGLSSMVFLVDPRFVVSSSIMDVAVALEYALQQATRRMDTKSHALKSRFSDASYSLIALSISMEINSDIQVKFSQLTPSRWNNLVGRNLDDKLIDSFGARRPPTLPEGSLTCESFNFPPELTAESYLQLLMEMDEKMERDWLNEHDGDKNKNSEDDNEEEVESGEESGSADTGEQLTEGGDNSNSTGADSDQGEGCGNGGKEVHTGGTDGSQGTTEGGSGEESTSQDSGCEQNGDSQGSSLDSSGQNESADGDVSNTSGNSSASPQDASGSTQGEDLLDQDLIDEVNNTDTPDITNANYQSLDKQLRAQASPETMHYMTVPQKPKNVDDTAGVSELEKGEVHKELAQEIDDYMKGEGDYSDSGVPAGGIGISDQFVEWKKTVLRKPKMSWKKVLPSVLNRVTGRSMTSGMTDLSFSKRNPNQQDNMPLMMGLITYPPTVNVLIDASPSMSVAKDDVLSEFISIISHFYMNYGEPVGIIVADNKIKYYHKSATVSRSVKKRVSRTYMGGSRGSGSGDGFGDTMKKVMRGKARYKGKPIPKADITIVFTDGGFDWPYPNNGRLPSSVGSVIIVSTVGYQDLKNESLYSVPSWVKNKKNFISIN